jgi:hypothetical protein
MQRRKEDIRTEKRKALKYLAGISGLALGMGLSRKWVSPSLQAGPLFDVRLSRTPP